MRVPRWNARSLLHQRHTQYNHPSRLLPSRFFSTTLSRRGQLSVYLSNPRLAFQPDKAIQDDFLHQVALYATEFPGGLASSVAKQMVSPTDSDALFVAVSPELAPWLNQRHFVESLVQALIQPRRVGENLPEEVDVVGAVVSGIPFGTPGLSLLHGRAAEVFPDFNLSPDPCSQPPDPPGHLYFKFNSQFPNHKGSRYLDATLTLERTTTLEQPDNPSPSLFAGRLRLANTDPGLEAWNSNYQLYSWVGKKHLTVVPDTFEGHRPTEGNLPLMAITPPRTILEDFGNILRTIEVDGVPCPASRELERHVERLLAEVPNPGPVKIWAYIFDQDDQKTVDHFTSLFNEERLDSFFKNEEAETQAGVPARLLVDGCTISQVVSGGGGWGRKAGLLCLDPEVFARNDEACQVDEGFSRFKESFERAQNPEGFVPRRRMVQFFIGLPNPSPPPTSPGTTLGISIPVDEDYYKQSKPGPLRAGSNRLTAIVGHFGALASRGLYLRESWHKDRAWATVSTSGAYIHGKFNQ